MLGFHHEWIVIRWYGNIGGPFTSEAEALERYNSVSGSTLYRRLIWKPRIQVHGWRFKDHREWDERGKPPWWETGKVEWGWL